MKLSMIYKPILLSAALAIGLAGCGNTNQNASTTEEGSAPRKPRS